MKAGLLDVECCDAKLSIRAMVQSLLDNEAACFCHSQLERISSWGPTSCDPNSHRTALLIVGGGAILVALKSGYKYVCFEVLL